MQKRRHQLGLHPLPQAEFAHLPVQIPFEREHVGELRDPVIGLGRADAVDRGMDAQRIERRQIPDSCCFCPSPA